MEQLIFKYCSVELAQKLVDFGVNFTSQYVYVKTINGYKIELREPFYGDCLPAYDVAELGLLLPEELNHIDSISKLNQFTYTEKGFLIDFRLYYQNNRSDKRFPNTYMISDASEANVRAKMLIYILENSLYSKYLMEHRVQFIKFFKPI